MKRSQVRQSKRCTGCGKVKDVSEFHRSVANAGGLVYRCKQCACEYGREWRCRNPDYVRAQGIRQRADPEYVFGVYRRNAEAAGRSFTLTLQEFAALLREPCGYCGQAPSWGVDRVRNGEGYTAINAIPCCGICNRMKRDRSRKEFLRHVKRIAAYCGNKEKVAGEEEE